MKQKLANRSDRQALYQRELRSGGGRSTIHRGMAKESKGKFLALTPAEERARRAARQQKTLEFARGHGWSTVRAEAGSLLAGHGVVCTLPPGYESLPDVVFVPESCATLIKLWEDAQKGEGEGARINEFRKLSLTAVCWLAAEEFKQLERR